jgi:hypothetical protein
MAQPKQFMIVYRTNLGVLTVVPEAYNKNEPMIWDDQGVSAAYINYAYVYGKDNTWVVAVCPIEIDVREELCSARTSNEPSREDRG